MIKKIVTGSIETNTYLIIEDNKCVLIDPGLDFENAANEIKKEYIVEKIIITHGHLDHIDGIKYFDCPIYIHQKEVEFLFDPSLSLYQSRGKRTPFTKDKINVIAIKDNDTIDIFGIPMKVMHTPGHTRGSIILLYKDKVFTGDTLFQEDTGRTDLPTGSEKDMINSIFKIFDNLSDNYKVYPGHDVSTTIKEERKNNVFYQSIKKRFIKK